MSMSSRRGIVVVRPLARSDVPNPLLTKLTLIGNVPSNPLNAVDDMPLICIGIPVT